MPCLDQTNKTPTINFSPKSRWLRWRASTSHFYLLLDFSSRAPFPSLEVPPVIGCYTKISPPDLPKVFRLLVFRVTCLFLHAEYLVSNNGFSHQHTVHTQYFRLWWSKHLLFSNSFAWNHFFILIAFTLLDWTTELSPFDGAHAGQTNSCWNCTNGSWRIKVYTLLWLFHGRQTSNPRN